MSKNDGVIRFQAQIAGVKTLADGGIRITLDLKETDISTASEMMKARQSGLILEVAAIAVKEENKEFDFGFEVKAA